MPTSGLPDKRRLLIFALGLPAVVVAVDQLTWASRVLIPDYDVRRTIFLWWLVTASSLSR